VRQEHSRLSSGMTIIEVVLAMVLLSMMLGAVLSAVELSARTQHSTADATYARSLAADLLEEVCGFAYADPAGAAEFAVGGDENAADRSTFDDVDDFDGWSESPPIQSDGTPVPGSDGWTRIVNVKWVDPLDPSIESVTETGAKRVQVGVSRGGVTYAVITRIRTAALDASADTGG